MKKSKVQLDREIDAVLQAPVHKFRAEHIAIGHLQDGSTVTISAWSKSVFGRAIYGAHFIQPDGTRVGVRTPGSATSLASAMKQAKAVVAASLRKQGSIKWDKAAPAGPSDPSVS